MPFSANSPVTCICQIASLLTCICQIASCSLTCSPRCPLAGPGHNSSSTRGSFHCHYRDSPRPNRDCGLSRPPRPPLRRLRIAAAGPRHSASVPRGRFYSSPRPAPSPPSPRTPVAGAGRGVDAAIAGEDRPAGRLCAIAATDDCVGCTGGGGGAGACPCPSASALGGCGRGHVTAT